MSTMNLKVGQVVKLTLNENPTTGYSWMLAVSPGLEIISDKYISPNNNLIGAGGKHEWKIKVISNGYQLISGVYKRPWEPLTNSDQRYMRIIDVE